MVLKTNVMLIRAKMTFSTIVSLKLSLFFHRSVSPPFLFYLFLLERREELAFLYLILRTWKECMPWSPCCKNLAMASTDDPATSARRIRNMPLLFCHTDCHSLCDFCMCPKAGESWISGWSSSLSAPSLLSWRIGILGTLSWTKSWEKKIDRFIYY